MDGVSDTVHYQTSQILSEDSYLRIQGRLTDAMDDMDDASRTNIQALRLFGEGLVRDHSKGLKKLAKRLVPEEEARNAEA